MPDQPAFGGGAASTVLHPIVAVAMIITLVLIIALPRKYVIFPVLACLFLVPLGQQIVIGGVHWWVSRIILLCGLVKVRVIGRDRPAGGFNSVDQAFLSCVLIEVVAVLLQYGFASQAWINQFGFLIDYLAGYFLFRSLMQEEEDLYRAIACIAIITVILGVCMMREQSTGQNVFGILGGTRLYPEIRNGKIRAQGVFQHSLTAGAFAGVLAPLFLLLWKNGKSKGFATLGLVGSTAMTIFTNGSTPLLAYAGGLGAVCLWRIRGNMRSLRRGLALGIVALHLVMKAPVWFLIARIDLTGSSSGYHRAQLVDMFIRHFWDWWLIGSHAMLSWGYDIWDAQNEFVSVGETGGLAALIFFIVMITRSFARLGNARRLVQGEKREWLFWLLGAALFANITAFFGVNYFDQTKEAWFLLLAMISAVTAPVLAGTRPLEAEITPPPIEYQEVVELSPVQSPET